MLRALKKKASSCLHRRTAPVDSPPNTNGPVILLPTTTPLGPRCAARDTEIAPASAPPAPTVPLGEAHLEPDHQPHHDASTPRYVPFVDASPLKHNMFSSPTSRYGRVNASIMGGFGGDDESIWLVDDEETDDEAQPPTPQDSPKPQEPGPGPSSTPSSRPAFQYRSPFLLDDDEFTTAPTPAPAPEPQAPAPAPEPVPRRGYAPISSSILAGFESDQESSSTHKLPRGGNTNGTQGDPVPAASSSSSTNPYVALFEQHEQAMTVAYLRRLDQPGAGVNDLADDFSFGQRYQRALDTTDVIVTHQRVPASHVSGDRECVVCAETKPVNDFPRFSVTASCTHSPSTCLECVGMSIRSDLDSKLWTEIRCPECRELLEYNDIQRYSDEETFLRYESLALRAAMAEADNFFWCTADCGSGQIHDSGTAQPIVTCLHCNHRSCFEHNVPWHQNLTCEEYTRLLADPDNFRSQMELDNDEWAEIRAAQMDADRAMAQGLVAEEQEDMNRREAREREERQRSKKAAALARQIAKRRKLEEDQSHATVSKTTKPCPDCGWAIEKSSGCSHMTCIKCRHEFCWSCTSAWLRGHNNYCNAGPRRR